MIFAPSIWTLEIDGKPTLAFEAMKDREADEICHQEWLRLDLALQLPFLKISESMGNHDSKIVDADSVDRRNACVMGCVAS